MAKTVAKGKWGADASNVSTLYVYLLFIIILLKCSNKKMFAKGGVNIRQYLLSLS